jgi:hypothetical protein
MALSLLAKISFGSVAADRLTICGYFSLSFFHFSFCS